MSGPSPDASRPRSVGTGGTWKEGREGGRTGRRLMRGEERSKQTVRRLLRRRRQLTTVLREWPAAASGQRVGKGGRGGDQLQGRKSDGDCEKATARARTHSHTLEAGVSVSPARFVRPSARPSCRGASFSKKGGKLARDISRLQLQPTNRRGTSGLIWSGTEFFCHPGKHLLNKS